MSTSSKTSTPQVASAKGVEEDDERISWFQRIELDEDGDDDDNPDCTLSPDEFLHRFQQVGFVWFRIIRKTRFSNGGRKDDKPGLHLPTSDSILKFLKQHAEAVETSWSIENVGTYDKESDITPTSLGGDSDGNKNSFYVSTIIHNNNKKKTTTTACKKTDDTDGDFSAFDTLQTMLPPLPDVLEDLHLTSSGMWLFLGKNNVVVSAASENDENNNKKKRKRSNKVMIGRAEHCDDVVHSGTFHVQLSGEKTWYIRPNLERFSSSSSSDDLPPLPPLSSIPGSEQSETTKSWYLKITVEEGDYFVLNTKSWYHYTELPPSSSNYSISIARDFFLPIPSLENFEEGDVVMEEDDIPDDIPRTSDNPNCILAEIECDGDDDEGDDARIALVATCDIKKGDFLSIPEEVEDDGSDDGEEDDGDLHNANETVDPRAIATKDFKKDDICLMGDGIPLQLPRSYEPNVELCEIDDDNRKATVVLKAIQDIAAGNVFCILPDEDEEYEEVEVDLTTTELKRR